MNSRYLQAAVFSSIALAVPMVAQAHSEYDHSNPPAGATVTSSPASITVVFTEELSTKGSDLQVRDAQNTRVDADDSQIVNGNPKNTMTISLKPSLPNGVYTVRWRTNSADDGDDASGTFSFGVGVSAPSTTTLKTEAEVGTPFDVTGTVVSHSGKSLRFVTSDLSGWPETITIDASDIKRSNIRDGDALTLTIAPRAGNSAIAWDVVSQGSRTDQAEFGARGEFATKNESSEVFNRADDDEARAKDKDHRGKED